MTEAEKVTLVSGMSGEADVDVVAAYLVIAGQKICRKLYPFDNTQTEIPSAYEYLQVEAAVYLLNKRGAEGETTHNENGISRVYENADLPDSMLRDILPMCGVAT